MATPSLSGLGLGKKREGSIRLGLMRLISAPVSTSANKFLVDPSAKVTVTLTLSLEHLGIDLDGLSLRVPKKSALLMLESTVVMDGDGSKTVGGLLSR